MTKKKKRFEVPEVRESGTATIEEATRELPSARSFRLWLRLSCVHPSLLEAGERKLAAALGIQRETLRFLLAELCDAGYAVRENPPALQRDASGKLVPGRISITRCPMFTNEDRIVALGRARSVRRPFERTAKLAEAHRLRTHGGGFRSLLSGREVDDD